MRLESGDDTGQIKLENALRVLRALGVLDEAVRALDPFASDVGRLRAEEHLPQRVRPRRLTCRRRWLRPRSTSSSTSAAWSSPAGRLWSHRRRNAESASFAYRDEYLTHPHAYALDPAAAAERGQYQTPLGRAIFGAFSDSAPDRCGRPLIHRTEAQRAKREGGGRAQLRRGRLPARRPRRPAPGRAALPPAGQRHVPGRRAWRRARRCSAAEAPERRRAPRTRRGQRGGAATLLRGGSSLGGARPKAHVIDADGRLAIAKFPSPASDEWDVIRWEAVALELARAAGLAVPAARAAPDRRASRARRRSLRPFRHPPDRLRERDDHARDRRRRARQLPRHRLRRSRSSRRPPPRTCASCGAG